MQTHAVLLDTCCCGECASGQTHRVVKKQGGSAFARVRVGRDCSLADALFVCCALSSRGSAAPQHAESKANRLLMKLWSRKRMTVWVCWEMESAPCHFGACCAMWYRALPRCSAAHPWTHSSSCKASTAPLATASPFRSSPQATGTLKTPNEASASPLPRNLPTLLLPTVLLKLTARNELKPRNTLLSFPFLIARPNRVSTANRTSVFLPLGPING